MWHTLSSIEVEKKLNTNFSRGLSSKEAEKRAKVFGKNKLDEKKKVSFISKLIAQFKDFMIIILLIAAVISAIISYLEGSNDYMDSIIIVAIVFFNAMMGIIQENKAEKSLEALRKLSAPVAKVKRDGKVVNIESSNLVPGDVIILEAGNLVPADCHLVKAFNLKVEESALTGEAVPVLKDPSVILKQNVPLGDMLNTVFSSTIVTNGHGEAIVTDIGMSTKVGTIAKMIITDESPQTPLQKKLSDVGKKLGTACIIICIAIFIIGLIKKISFIEIFMTSIGLAVAAIPEGLPAIVTIMLSIGVTKMAKKNAIIRKLPAVETLGSSSVICSDKTGTLTQNKMKVVKITGVNGILESGINSKDFNFVLELGSMCNDSIVEYSGRKATVNGEPTEAAIVTAGIKYGAYSTKLKERVNEIPFDSGRKMMTTIHKTKTGYRIVTKGAPDVILKRCSNYYSNSNTYTLNRSNLSSIESNNEKMANEALRVIAVSFKDVDSLPRNIDSNSIEKDLNFVGLIGMIDPPREGVFEAILTCKKAGIKTVMITGDHILTAKAIASNLGILSKNDLAITGEELDKIPQNKLEKDIMKYSVFARVTPEHKVRIVKAFKARGAIVAMTGDGVNDAPALKNADIGVSMGLNGTDVAKNASDMILTDDNFVTIVEAVKEGRHIYDNIRKAVHFLIATNVGEIVTIFFGLLLGLESPLLAIQLLWINLVTDSFPAIGLGLEPIDKAIMHKKPKDPKKGLFSDGLWSKIFFEGTMIGLLTLFAFTVGNHLYGLEVARTMAFISLSMLELVHSFNIRSENSIFEIGIFKNKYLNIAFLAGAILQIAVVVIKPIAKIFDVVPLNTTQWIFTFAISITPIVIMEFKKKLKELRYGKRVYNIKAIRE
mgnify:FL=1